MNDLPSAVRVLKSLIAPARYSDGPTLYLICAADPAPCCAIYEHSPEGRCLAWPETAERGVQQAESMIYQRASRQN